MKYYVRYLLMFAFLVTAVTMCKPAPEPVEEVCSVSFSAKISQLTTRATDTAFEEGDEISVFACHDASLGHTNYAHNIRYSYSDDIFRTSYPITYPAKDAALTFYAVYPFGNYSMPEMRFTVSNDQSTESAYTDSDMMTASAIAKDQELVSLKFSHRLAKVVLDIAGASEGRRSVTFVNLYTSVDADIAENIYCEAGSRYSVRACNNGENSFKVILPPQKINAGTLLAEIKIDDKVYEWITESDIYLSSGIEHKYTVTIKDSVVVISADINDWDKISGEVDADRK